MTLAMKIREQLIARQDLKYYKVMKSKISPKQKEIFNTYFSKEWLQQLKYDFTSFKLGSEDVPKLAKLQEKKPDIVANNKSIP